MNERVAENKYNVFLSWSGQRSQALALFFSKWLPRVIQVAKPFYSDEEIPKGTTGYEKIREALKTSSFGVAFITRENSQALWIHSEIGALWGDKKECSPFMIDGDIGEIKGLIPTIQQTKPDRDDVLRLIHSIRDILIPSLSDEVVDRAFEREWSDLDKKIKEVQNTTIEEGNVVNQSQKHIYLSAHMERSERVATYFYEWLPKVIKGVNLFYSEKDVPIGGYDRSERNREAIKHSSMGVVFVTRENSKESQIDIERGGMWMAKCPCVRFVIDPDVELPEDIMPKDDLVTTEKASIHKMILSIRTYAAEKFSIECLEEAFEQRWPELEAKIREVQSTKADPAEKRTGAVEWYEAVEEAEKVNPYLAEQLQKADADDEQECRKLADELNKKINADINKLFVDVYKFYPPDNVLAAINTGQKFLPTETVKAIQSMQSIYKHLDLPFWHKAVSSFPEPGVMKQIIETQKRFNSLNMFKSILPPDADKKNDKKNDEEDDDKDDAQPLLPVKKK